MFGKKKEMMIEREDGLVDYDIYVMGKGETVFNIIIAAIVLFTVGYIFYHSVILSAILMLFALKWPKIRTRQIIAKRKEQLTLQFKEMLYSLASALAVGKSVPTGLFEAMNDLKVVYPDPSTPIIAELEYIVRGLNVNQTVESMLTQFANRAHVEDIDNFVDIFVTCNRTGGDLIQVMHSASNTIGEKIEVKQEIKTMISGKKFEFQAMMAMPIVMVLFLSSTSKAYMEPVFSTIAGRIAMTVAIFIFIMSYFIGLKVMKIEV